MCFQWMKRIFHCLRGRCARRNRGYNNEITLHHSGYYSGTGSCSGLQGHGSFFCDGEGSVTYSRRPSSWQPMPTSSTHSLSGEYRCSSDGSVVITSGDSGGTSGWGTAGGTVPVYGPRVGVGYSGEDSGPNIASSSGDGGGFSHHSGNLPVGGGYGYGYDESPRERPFTAGGGSGGPGYCSRGSGYITEGCPDPELSSGGRGCSQTIQQKCPVVIPNIKAQQTKQTSHWPPSQKK